MSLWGKTRKEYLKHFLPGHANIFSSMNFISVENQGYKQVNK